MLVFEERGKPEYMEKNLSEQSREPTTNSTHIWRRVRESNPGHIDGRRALSSLRQPCSPTSMCIAHWGLELPTPNPGSKSTPKACPTHNPATNPACHTWPQPKHPSHRAKSSVKIIITVITNNNNNNDNNNNNNNNNNKRERRVGENTPKTDQDAPNTKHVSKTATTCNGTRINCNNNCWPGSTRNCSAPGLLQ